MKVLQNAHAGCLLLNDHELPALFSCSSNHLSEKANICFVLYGRKTQIYCIVDNIVKIAICYTNRCDKLQHSTDFVSIFGTHIES